MFKVFNNKKIITKNGVQMIDFLTPSIKWSGEKVTITETVFVTDRFEMRPDLISQSAYSSSSKADLFLKYNGISNPFSIQSGDILIIPDEESMGAEFWNGIEPIEAAIPAKRKKITNKTKEDFNRKVEKNWKDSNTPNIAKDNKGNPLSPNIEFKGGVVTFGNNIGKPKEECCGEPLSKSEFLKKIIKNRIKNGG